MILTIPSPTFLGAYPKSSRFHLFDDDLTEIKRRFNYEKILTYLAEHPMSLSSVIAKETGIETQLCSANLCHMRKKGMVESVSKRDRHQRKLWRVA
jgi:predicted Rossmann fold nucleotide-binding protein DprA/Smf involved in DNA uptake